MRKLFRSAINAALCDSASFKASNPSRCLACVNSIPASISRFRQEFSVQHTTLSSVMLSALRVLLEGSRHKLTFNPAYNSRRSLGDVITIPPSSSRVHHGLSTQNVGLQPFMSTAIGNLLGGISRGSIPCPMITVSPRTSSDVSMVQAKIDFGVRGFTVDLEPSAWTIVEGMLKSISQKNVVISLTSNHPAKPSHVGDQISHALELQPLYLAPQHDASKFIIPSINISAVNYPQQSIPTASSFPDISASMFLGVAVTGICWGPEQEPAKLPLQHMKKYISPAVIPAASNLTTLPSAPVMSSSLSLSLEPSSSEPQNKVPKNNFPSLDLSDMDILEPSNLANPSFDPIVEAPVISGLELTRLGPQSDVSKWIIPSTDISDINYWRSLCFATSSFNPHLVSEILDTANSQGISPEELEPADSVTQYETPKCHGLSIILSPGDVPSTFPSTAPSFFWAFAEKTREEPIENSEALQAIQETLALHLQKHKEVKTRAKKAPSRLWKCWTHGSK